MTYKDARRAVELQLVIETAQAELDAIKDSFRTDTPGTVTLEAPALGDGPMITVKVSPNKRVDDRLAQENLPSDVYETVSKRTIDTAKARAFLTSDDLDKITKVYDNKVEIKLV